MASLKKNIQIIHDGLVKNIAIVSGQAREQARAAAYEYMQNRGNQDLSILKNAEFESTNAVIAWLTKLDSVVKEIPDLPDEEELLPVEPAPSHTK